MPLLSASPAELDTPENLTCRGGAASTVLPAAVRNESAAAMQVELTDMYYENLPAVKDAAIRLQDAMFGNSPRVVDFNFGPLLPEIPRPALKRELPGPILPGTTPEMIWEREAASRHESVGMLLRNAAAREVREYEHLRPRLPETSHQPSRRLGQFGGAMSQFTAHAMHKHGESRLPVIPQAASGGGEFKPLLS